MAGRATFLRVGLLVVVATALLLGMMLFLLGNRLREGKRYETYYSESVQGLEVGAPVKYRGVTIGRVTDIGLTSAAYLRGQPPDARMASFRLVFVRFVIDPSKVGRLPDTASAVQSGLRARLASQGLTGLSYVELDFASPNRYPPISVPWKPEGEYIPSMPSTLTQVQDAGQLLLAQLSHLKIDALAANLDGLITDLRGQMRDGDAQKALAGLAGLTAAAQQQLAGADLPGLSAALRQTAAAAQTLLAGKETRGALASAAQAADRLAEAARRLPALLTALQATAQRAGHTTGDAQAALAPILRDLQAAAANLRDTSETLRRYPASTLFGGPPPRPEDAR